MTYFNRRGGVNDYKTANARNLYNNYLIKSLPLWINIHNF
jgi:hypothetical protein